MWKGVVVRVLELAGGECCLFDGETMGREVRVYISFDAVLEGAKIDDNNKNFVFSRCGEVNALKDCVQ